jgi:GT2 family glycosyltransferase
MLDTKPLIFICIPNLGEIRVELVDRLLSWTKSKHNIAVYMPPGMLPLDNARSHCLSKFIEISNNENDRLLFIDADIVPPVNALDILIAHDKDVVGLLCFMIKPNESGMLTPLPIAMRYNKNNQYNVYFDGVGLTEVDALGGGCIMSKRKVFEAIGGRCFEFHYYPDGKLSLVGDYDYCQKVQKAGFKIYVDFANTCGHIKSVDLKSINDLMIKVQNG